MGLGKILRIGADRAETEHMAGHGAEARHVAVIRPNMGLGRGWE